MSQYLSPTITLLEDKGDQRGSTFNIPPKLLKFIVKVKNIHVTTLRSGHIRGNHYHSQQCEMLIILHEDNWMFCWDNGKDTQVQNRYFSGQGAVLIEIEPFVSHAIKNVGKKELHIVAITDREYNPLNLDSSKNIIAE